MDKGSGHIGGLLPNSLPGHASGQHYLLFGSRSHLITGMLLSAILDTWMLTSPLSSQPTPQTDLAVPTERSSDQDHWKAQAMAILSHFQLQHGY